MRLAQRFLFVAAASLAASPALAQVGDVAPVHDPSVIESNGVYYLFCTGRGIPIRSSTDLYHWTRVGSLFSVPPFPPRPRGPATRPMTWPQNWHPGGPAWTHAYSGGFDSFWAPDITYFAGQYHVYYGISTFGQTHSAIGLATSPTLDPTSPQYHWTDLGKVVETHADDDHNAIDPAVFIDTDQKAWMVFGSCWSGIKLVELNPATGLLADPAKPPQPIVARPGGKPLEEGYLTHRGDWYYLWASFDHCCRGVRSDYRIVLGRAKSVTGPFIDRDGVRMLDGGGTTILASAGTVRGPGSSAVLHTANADWLFYHFYDANHRGIPTLQIRRLNWNDEDWPSAGDPIAGPVNGGPATEAGSR